MPPRPPASVAEQVQLATHYCVLHTVPMAIAATLLFAWGLTEPGLVMVFLVCMYLPVFVLRYMGRFDAMRHWMSFGPIVDIIIFDLYMGAQGNARLLLLAHAMMPFCIFTDREEKWRTFWAVVPGLCFLGLVWSNTVTPIFEPHLTGASARWFSVLPASVTAIDLLTRVRLYTRRSARARAQLEEATLVAQRASAAKSEFLANMSHELRTPLNGIVGLTDLLRKSDLGQEHHQDLATIAHSADALLLVIGDILDFTDIEAGRLVLHPAEFLLQDVLESATDLLAAQVQHNGVALTMRWEGSPPPPLLGDAGRVRQIVVNLLSNAMRFTARGHIAVRAGSTPRDKHTQACWVEVADTGIGIAPEDQSKLFRSFQQVDNTSTRKSGGTGLGLAICERLVASMDGEISVTSVLGQGSTFRVAIVLALAHTNTRPAWDPVTSPGPVVVVHSDVTTADNLVQRCRDELAIQAKLVSPTELRNTEIDDATTVLVDAACADASTVRGWRRVVLTATHPQLVTARALAEELGARALAIPPTIASLREAIQWSGRPIAAPDPTLAGEGMTILVVDDNRINRMVCEKMLHKLGATVQLAEDGAQAVALATEHTYDLILMDLQMPVMDGFEATQKIRACEGEARRAIYALTANALPEDEAHANAVGMDAFLTKPIKLAALGDVLRSLQATG